jgi:hypothetical protein
MTGFVAGLTFSVAAAARCSEIDRVLVEATNPVTAGKLLLPSKNRTLVALTATRAQAELQTAADQARATYEAIRTWRGTADELCNFSLDALPIQRDRRQRNVGAMPCREIKMGLESSGSACRVGSWRLGTSGVSSNTTVRTDFCCRGLNRLVIRRTSEKQTKMFTGLSTFQFRGQRWSDPKGCTRCTRTN